MYAYHIVVDGVQMADPNNTYAAFTAMPPYSQLVVHGDGPAYYDAKDVPHGGVTRHVYRSDVTDGQREIYVYTPPGYDANRRYPVLYLVGGSGELPSNWIYDGRVNFIMDNLLAEGKAEPMIIAIPNNQIIHRSHPQHTELTFDLFEQELRDHVVPLIDREYATIPAPQGRAIGWYAMALVEILDVMPAAGKHHDELIGIFERLVVALEHFQDEETGLWYQVVDLGHREGNYLEASASAMYVYAIAKGVNDGRIDPSYMRVAERGYDGIIEHLVTLDDDGEVHLNQVCGVAGLGGRPYRDG